MSRRTGKGSAGTGLAIMLCTVLVFLLGYLWQLELTPYQQVQGMTDAKLRNLARKRLSPEVRRQLAKEKYEEKYKESQR